MFNIKRKNKGLSVLMVCMGNICRSPTAEAILKKKSKDAGLRLHIDSAGTLALHKGNRPDARSILVGERAGYKFRGLRSRPVVDEDFENFDLILAMDDQNMRELLIRCPLSLRDKVKLLLNYANSADVDAVSSEVPDPYYGGSKGFELVLGLVEQGCDGLITAIKTNRHYD